ncbi:MAG: type II secretion system protein [Bacilli bacterium]|nr:type II secretion system protein [Bacilli bacterium]
MKDNRGFTLIELLAVLIILAVIALVVTPVVTTTIQAVRESSAESQEQLVISAAKNWASNNSDLLSDTIGDTYTVYVSTLGKEDYLSKKQIQDLVDSKTLTNACVKITTEEHKYTYEFQKKCE